MKTLAKQVFAFGAISDANEHAIAATVDLEGADSWSATLVWTSGAAPIGTFTAKASDKEDATSPSDGSFTTLLPTAPISGNSGSTGLRDSDVASYRRLRLGFQLSSGNATFTLYLTLKRR